MSDIVIGLNPGQTNEEYHGSEGVSKSKLDDISPELRKSPKHYWAKHIDPEREPEKRTDAKILGDAIHKAVLEPDLVSEHFVVLPPDAPARPTKQMLEAKKPSLESIQRQNWWADFQAEHGDKTILTADQFKTILGCRDAVHTHPIARGLFSGGNAEQSFYARDPQTGALIKCRLDYDRLEKEGMIVDLKSTLDASEDGFGADARKYRYDVQGWWYPNVIHTAYNDFDIVRHFVFVPVEKEWPHAVGVYHMTAELVPAAEAMARRDLGLIIDCMARDEWPDFSTRDAPSRPLAIRRRIERIG